MARSMRAGNARRHGLLGVALPLVAIIIVIIVLGGSVSTTPAAVDLVGPEAKLNETASKVIVVHTLRSRTGARIAAWSAASGQIAIAFEGSRDVAMVDGRKLTYWSERQLPQV